jgi:hypothetical protein
MLAIVLQFNENNTLNLYKIGEKLMVLDVVLKVVLCKKKIVAS